MVTGTDELARFIVQSLAEGVLVVDPALLVVFANRQVEQQFGYSPGQLIGRPVDVILPGAAQEEGVLRRGLGRTATANTVRHLVGRRRDQSECPVDVTVTPLAVGAATYAVVVIDTSAPGRVASAWPTAAERQLEFERVVGELCARFVNLEIATVDDEIREALRRIGETLDLDRCTLFRFSPFGGANERVEWRAAGISAAPLPTSARYPFVFETIIAGHEVCFADVDQIPNPTDRAGYRALGVRSGVVVGVSVDGRVIGGIAFELLREERTWPADAISRLRVFATACGNVFARRDLDHALQRALTEVDHLRATLQHEHLDLRADAREQVGGASIVGQSRALSAVMAQVQQVATTASTVLLLGETGTGKELFASRIHDLSNRRGRPMVRVNCAAIPSTLIESELFGREKGAFTGALARQVGRFELADQSTIFLDEIGDLPMDVQIKLLRVLEERQIERLGSPKPIHVNTRIIAATHRDLEQRVAEGAFREDLFYRLNVFPIRVPPLRERVEDIPILVWRFVEQLSRALGKGIEVIPHENIEALQRYPWPGNIRELRNVVERAMILATGPRLTISLPSPPSPAKPLERLDAFQREHIRSVLELTGWRIRGPAGAAERLGMRPTTLETRMAKLGLKRPAADTH